MGSPMPNSPSSLSSSGPATVKRAIAADLSGDAISAIKLYTEALQIMAKDLKNTRDPNHQAILRARINEYLSRAEELKIIIASGNNNNNPKSPRIPQNPRVARMVHPATRSSNSSNGKLPQLPPVQQQQQQQQSQQQQFSKTIPQHPKSADQKKFMISKDNFVRRSLSAPVSQNGNNNNNNNNGPETSTTMSLNTEKNGDNNVNSVEHNGNGDNGNEDNDDGDDDDELDDDDDDAAGGGGEGDDDEGEDGNNNNNGSSSGNKAEDMDLLPDDNIASKRFYWSMLELQDILRPFVNEVMQSSKGAGWVAKVVHKQAVLSDLGALELLEIMDQNWNVKFDKLLSMKDSLYVRELVIWIRNMPRMKNARDAFRGIETAERLAIAIGGVKGGKQLNQAAETVIRLRELQFSLLAPVAMELET